MVLQYITAATAFIDGASRLVETLRNALPHTSSSTPGLVSSVQQNQRYSEALQLYQQQLAQSQRNQEQQLQAQLQFNKRLIELLSEVQIKNNEVKRNELQLIWDRDNWGSRLSREETQQILGQNNHHLLILVAPPNVSPDCPESFRNNLSREVDNNTRIFLSHHYSQNQFCPIEFYGDYFKNAIAAADVRRLQIVLGAVPTAVIYTDITDYQVYFHIGFWGLQGTITQFDMQPWDWEKAVEELKSEGLDEQKAYRKIRQTIVEFHQLLAAFITDWYYLNLNVAYEPQLFQPEISFDGLPKEVIEQYTSVLREIQQQRKEAFEQEEAQKKAEETTKNKQKEFASQMSEEEKKKLNERLQNSEISYQKLRSLLATKQWKRADKETYRLMRGLINLPYSKLDAVQTRCLPKADVHRIDQLWVKYSKGQFGFSVQNKIWQRSRFRAEFLDRIAFSEPPAYYHREFDLGSPKGSLPCKILWEVDYAVLYDEFFTD
ncbi:GUN4 domain-containing protein [Leptolyngbya sp. AN03gr2]|uniref:GUN4 domain-containing protein n=1 Tax=unclassified Leptolyngbya TaxID=2650499 RepID=UPI003D322F53